MSFYYKIGQSVTTQSGLIALIRGFLTHASLGWVESDHTSASTSELLLKTKSQHMGNYGILHLISDVSGSPEYLRIHAYPPDYAAFQSPNSFDSPDTAYLPGGGSYVEANEYFNSAAGNDHEIDFTFPCTVDMYGDGNTFLIYITGGTKKWAWMGLLTDRELDHGWFQIVHGLMPDASVKNGANIRKTNTFMNWINPAKSSGYPGAVSTQLTNVPDTELSDWIIQALIIILETDYNEILDLPYVYFCNDDAARGHEFTLGANTYRVVVPGSETGYYHGIAVLKDTAIT